LETIFFVLSPIFQNRTQFRTPIGDALRGSKRFMRGCAREVPWMDDHHNNNKFFFHIFFTAHSNRIDLDNYFLWFQCKPFRTMTRSLIRYFHLYFSCCTIKKWKVSILWTHFSIKNLITLTMCWRLGDPYNLLHIDRPNYGPFGWNSETIHMWNEREYNLDAINSSASCSF
jgi:hypothetical protein